MTKSAFRIWLRCLQSLWQGTVGLEMEYKNTIDGIQKCLRNSEDLYNEAVHLYRKHAFARSYYLAVIAFEEIGKISVLLGNCGVAVRNNILEKKFWEHFFNPSFKMACCLTHANLQQYMKKEVIEILKFGEKLENTKKFALEISPDDSRQKILSPSHFFKKEDARSVIRLLKPRLELAKIGVNNLKKPEEFSSAEQNALRWLREKSTDRDFLAFINSEESYRVLNSTGSVLKWIDYLKENWTKKLEKDHSRIRYKEKNAKWHCITHIKSYSHILEEGIFDKWNETVDLVKFKRITERDIEMRLGIPPLKNKDELYARAIMLSYATLMALNVATLGHFWWPPAIWPAKIKELYDFESGNEVRFKISPRKDRQWGNKELTQKNLDNAMVLVVGQPKLDEVYFEFYGLAMTFLSIPNLEHQFYKEIFANFYKIIERLTAVNILGRKKLTKEKKQIKEVMKKLGMKEEIVDEFDEIYKVRSRDIMHSWGTEAPVTFEEAGKCKVLCDYFLYKYLRNEADKLVRQRKIK